MTDAEGTHATYLFTGEAVSIIEGHARGTGRNSPFFLYFAIPNVHAPVMVPDNLYVEHAAVLDKIENSERKAFAALTILADEAINNVTEALRSSGAYDNAVIVIASDNGGNPAIEGSGSNYPLRGMKGDLWEGGIRVHALRHSNRLPNAARGSTYKGLMHASDWVPTLVGGLLNSSWAYEGVSLDGIDQWAAITGAQSARPREELLINADDLSDADGLAQGYLAAAIRSGSYKLLMNVNWAPVWPAPSHQATDEETWPRADDDRIHELADYLFNIDEDETESDALDISQEPYKSVYQSLKLKVRKYGPTRTRPRTARSTTSRRRTARSTRRSSSARGRTTRTSRARSASTATTRATPTPRSRRARRTRALRARARSRPAATASSGDDLVAVGAGARAAAAAPRRGRGRAPPPPPSTRGRRRDVARAREGGRRGDARRARRGHDERERERRRGFIPEVGAVHLPPRGATRSPPR